MNPDGTRLSVSTNSKGQLMTNDAFGREVNLNEVFPINNIDFSI